MFHDQTWLCMLLLRVFLVVTKVVFMKNYPETLNLLFGTRLLEDRNYKDGYDHLNSVLL